MNANTKRNPLSKSLASLALALLLCLSIALPVLAGAGDSAAEPALAVITKIYRIPVNTDIPVSEFTFTFTKLGVNDGTDTTGMPDLGENGSISVSFGPTDTPAFPPIGNVRYFVKETPDIIDPLPKNGSSWGAGAGIYKYLVKENQSGIDLTLTLDDDEYPVYSTAEYELWVYVEEDINGTLFPKYVIGYYIPGKPDEYYPGTPGSGKLDPTPGTEVPGTPDEIYDLLSQIIFTNRYSKTDGKITDPDPDLNALAIKKQVTGNSPNYGVYYEFDVTVITPDEKDPANPKPYKAYIVDKDGNYIDLDLATNPNSKDGTGVAPDLEQDYITFVSGQLKKIHLKHDERLVFYTLEVGAEVRVLEKIEANTKVKYERTFSTAGEFPMPTGTTGTWGFPRPEGNNPPDVGPHYTKSGAGANLATFYNNQTGLPPTGITVDNLPYIVLIGSALAGLGVFAILKTRKKDKYEAATDEIYEVE
ncbi:MAG: hypothetical protein FWH48_01735 [Oscillospiraceae bacterium]|nr:hypothetical protein [Oscillospiraceae bacterium]